MDAAAATEPHKCKFTVQIDAAVDEQAFEAPSFRFRFLEGSKKQTPVIGAPGWTSLAAAQGYPDEAHVDEKPGTSELLQSPANTFRFEQVFCDVSVTEALANLVDDDPVLSFFFSDHSGLAGSAGISSSSSSQAKDAKGAAGNTKNAVPVPGSANQGTPDGSAASEQRAKAYAGIYDVDMSSLLAGKLQLEQIWTSGTGPTSSSGNESSSLSSVFSPKKKAESIATANQSLLCMPSLSIGSPSSSGLRYLAIRIMLDQPLLSTAMVKKLNPLTITISSARRLPGTMTTTATRSANLASPHTPLLQHCRPVYALLQFFPDKLSRAPLAGAPLSRILITPGKPQDEHIEWNHSVTFLSSRFNRAELLDALQYAALTVEIHDRDLTQVDKMRKLVAKWEALHTTGVDITAVNSNANRSLAIGDPGSSGTASSTTTPRNGLSQSQQQAPKPLEIFLVDDVAKRDCRLLLARSGEFFPHGVASFRLNELLNSAKQLVGVGRTSRETDGVGKPFISALKLLSDVVSVKRRATPLGVGVSGDDEDPFAVFDLTSIEKLVQEPGAYLASGTTLSIHVTLQYPIVKALSTSNNQHEVDSATNSELASDTHSQCLFSRMVLIIPYKDTSTVGQVARVMAAVNLAALPGVPIRSYQMTEIEKLACENGQLDVITGTQVIDSQFRTIFLEGLADKGMKLMHEQIPRKQQANDPQGYRMCANDQIRFTSRLYTAFEVIDLKRIKLRYPLPILMKAPDIYMRSKVSENCFKALTRLLDVRHATRLDEIKNLDLFLSAQMLLEVESKYGESITLEDIHGHGSGSNRHQTGKSSKALYSDVPAPIDAGPETSSGSADSGSPGMNGEQATNSSSKSSKRHVMTLKAPTDSSNDRFEQLCKSRKDKDFLSERKHVVFISCFAPSHHWLLKESDHVRCEYSEKKKLEEVLQQQSALRPVYMYSGQKLRTQDALQDEMPKQLAKDHHAMYTYSKEFQSLAMSLIDPDALRQTEELENRKKWTTQRGFVYPPPRNVEEYYKHKDVPSEARCEDLREPFVDNVNHPKPVSREAPNDNNCTRRRGQGGSSLPQFSTLPSKDMVFGGMNGDGTVNPDYFRSVHLCGEGLRQEQEEALKRELEDWELRLVVDRKQIKFLAHGNITSLPRKKPTQLDKIADILAGPVRSKPIRIIKNATLPSGKRVPLEAPPVTIHNQHEYAGSVATQFATTLRESDASQFLATHLLTGKPKDFLFPSNTDLLTPQVKKHVSRKKIVPVASSEKQGLVWRND